MGGSRLTAMLGLCLLLLADFALRADAVKPGSTSESCDLCARMQCEQAYFGKSGYYCGYRGNTTLVSCCCKTKYDCRRDQAECVCGSDQESYNRRVGIIIGSVIGSIIVVYWCCSCCVEMEKRKKKDQAEAQAAAAKRSGAGTSSPVTPAVSAKPVAKAVPAAPVAQTRAAAPAARATPGAPASKPKKAAKTKAGDDNAKQLKMALKVFKKMFEDGKENNGEEGDGGGNTGDTGDAAYDNAGDTGNTGGEHVELAMAPSPTEAPAVTWSPPPTETPTMSWTPAPVPMNFSGGDFGGGGGGGCDY